jgi:hypothetical protein
MKLENQVCSLKLSIKLKELGVKQESIFVWEYHNDKCYSVKYRPNSIVPDKFNNFKIYSAFMIAELGKMIPSKIIVNNITYYYATGKTHPNDPYHRMHEISFSNEEETFCLVRDNNEADTRAEMLIHLIERGLINET